MIQKLIRKILKPFQIASLATTYLLGAGLVQYVRGIQDYSLIIEGFVFLLLLILSTELVGLIGSKLQRHDWDEGLEEKQRIQYHWMIALLSATFLTVATSLFVRWVMRGILWQGLTFLLITLVAACMGYFLTKVIKPLYPFQIIMEMFLFLVLPPALAFFLQSSDLHRFLTLAVLCIAPAYLAYRLLIQLKHFGNDQKVEHHTIAVDIGWEKTMVFHNILILLTFLLFVLITFLGFPWFIIWPVFLTLPIGLVEIWLVERTRHGEKPLWRLMQSATAVVFFMPIYLIGFAFWIR